MIQLTINLPAKMQSTFEEKFKHRFTKSLPLVDKMNVYTTRTDGPEVTGNHKDKLYGCYIDKYEFLCGCIDNMTRKVICKHLLATVFAAIKQGDITNLDAMQLLIWRNKK